MVSGVQFLVEVVEVVEVVEGDRWDPSGRLDRTFGQCLPVFGVPAGEMRPAVLRCIERTFDRLVPEGRLGRADMPGDLCWRWRSVPWFGAGSLPSSSRRRD